MQNEQRLRQRINDLQQKWELLNEKLKHLERQRILETRAEEIFRLQHLIDETRTQLEQIEAKLKSFEAKLKSPEIDSKVKEIETALEQIETKLNSVVRHNLTFAQFKPTNIVGRDKEHRQILETLNNSDKPIILTSGCGGIGKSTLAMMVVWSCIEERRNFNFIVWIDVRRYTESQVISFNYILDEIAKTANPQSEIPSIINLDEKRNRVRELIKNSRSLLIFDNYEDLLKDKDEEKRISQFIRLLPIGSMKANDKTYTRVIITTRQTSEGLGDLPIYEIRLQKLSLKDSQKMMKLFTPQNIEFTNEQYRRVWEKLVGLPKYMKVAMEQLKTMVFEDWEKKIADITKELPDSGDKIWDKIFGNFFHLSWTLISDDLKKILLSMTYFVGEAPSGSLQKTSGLSGEHFRNILASTSDTYIQSTGTGYKTHSLTHVFCQAVLNSDEFADFRKKSSIRFIEYFLNLVKTEVETEELDPIEKQIRNIVAAVKLADKIQVWQSLIEFQKYLANFLRIRGYWQEQTEITELTVKACQQIGEKQILARCLVDDLGWLFLRFENLEKAEEYIKEGLKVFHELNDRQGVAQATRHLGKSALLKGLDEYYEPTGTCEPYFKEADHCYSESLKIRKQLEQEGVDQREKIGDMKLDFGRLYWLQGKKYEKDGIEQHRPQLIKKALQKYKQANQVSLEAKEIFEKINVDRGIAKAWGNLGNSTKEKGKCLLKENQRNSVKYFVQAHEYYESSLELAKKIERRDEISHALWGMAEVYEFYADHPDLGEKSGERNELINRALTYRKYVPEDYKPNFKGVNSETDLLEFARIFTEISHDIYRSLSGGKDINATRRLSEQIKSKLSSCSTNQVK